MADRDDEDRFHYDKPSKSMRKREAHALQEALESVAPACDLCASPWMPAACG